MITEFNFFKRKKNGQYWLVDTTNEMIFNLSLDKIGVNQKDKDYFIKSRPGFNSPSFSLIHNKIYIAHYFKNDRWDWGFVSDTYRDSFNNDNLEYMGEVKIENYELDANKYNL